ncbi:MAG TPA: 3-oxoacyl-[acyl-carrier-protein] synthase III C-terminal domain-containing protein [Kamptonema sp.]|nr:3-oxoacyl-[acyl-carrier-protein] synthase III C-terminal domain-containing protein [Kamptonema sp.]
MKEPVGIRSIAVSFPSEVRTNDYWRENYPELVEKAEQKSLAKAFTTIESDDEGLQIWSEEMKPYLSDPFRGTVERRVLGPGESSLTLENDAACKALKAAKLSVDEVDLMLVSSMFPEHIEQGNAAFLAATLGFRGAAWNIDSMCASPLIALQTACALIRSGEYHNVLVVTSCTYSRFFDENDTLSFFAGDGAGAFVVSALKSGQGIQGVKIVNTSDTCGIFSNEIATDKQGNNRMLIRANKNAGQKIPDLTLKYINECCQGALAAASATIETIDFFVCYAATAWYSSLCTRVLNIDPKRTIDLYPQYGNISAASIIAHLYHAAQAGKIYENDLILVYNHGFVGSAAAMVVRWGDVALGPTSSTSARLIKTAVGAM